jgi:hypothetical protein
MTDYRNIKPVTRTVLRRRTDAEETPATILASRTPQAYVVRTIREPALTDAILAVVDQQLRDNTHRKPAVPLIGSSRLAMRRKMPAA